MTEGQHRLKPPPNRTRLIAAVAAPLATLAVIGAGVVVTTTDDSAPTPRPRPMSIGQADARADLSAVAARRFSASAVSGAERTVSTSRDLNRLAVPKIVGSRWTTKPLKLRLTPAEDAKDAGNIEAIEKVAISGVTSGDYAQVVVNKKGYWVTAEYLAKSKPEPEPEPEPEPQPAEEDEADAGDSTPAAPSGLSYAACPDGSSIEAGLQPQSIVVYRAVCAAFPELSSYGGQDGHGEHVNGEAIDFMVPSGSVGERVKDFLYANRYKLDLFDIIWAQQIWTIQRDSEGFRGMEDRGSATANHFDHVHIKIN